MATHIGMYGVNLRHIDEVFEGGPARLSLIDDHGTTLDLVGPLLELRETLGQALDQLDAMSRERAKRNHSSLWKPTEGTDYVSFDEVLDRLGFTRDEIEAIDSCDGGSQPDAAVRWLTPAQAAAVEQLNQAMEDLAEFDNAFRPSLARREEQDRILDAMDDEYGDDAA